MALDRRALGITGMAAWLALRAFPAAARTAPSGPGLEVRTAAAADIDACVALVEATRRDLERYEPQFWKRATGATPATRTWFTRLLADPQAVFLVAGAAAEVVGFLIARIQPAPPVYDPGGPTALIDDFCVSGPGRWRDAGAILLAEARARLRARGVAQIVVVAPQKDRAKTAFLRAEDLSLASTWWTGKP